MKVLLQMLQRLSDTLSGDAQSPTTLVPRAPFRGSNHHPVRSLVLALFAELSGFAGTHGGAWPHHTTVWRWVQRYAPVLNQRIRRERRKPNRSWRVDETYVRVAGNWVYLYRAVDKLGQTVDFLLTAHRDVMAAGGPFERTIGLHDARAEIAIDKSGANTADRCGIVADSGAPFELRQSKHLYNMVEQDHRVIKRRIHPMTGFKDFHSTTRLVAGVETMHRTKKGQLRCPGGHPVVPAWPTPGWPARTVPTAVRRSSSGRGS